MSWVLKILLLWMFQAYGDVNSSSCGETGAKYEVACEGDNINLICPGEGPRIIIESAFYGRQQPESEICARSRTNTDDNFSNNDTCEINVFHEVFSRCNDKQKCEFIVHSSMFNDSCPHVYSYLIVMYQCTCTRRYPRSDVQSSCIPRPSFQAENPPPSSTQMISTSISRSILSTTHHPTSSINFSSLSSDPRSPPSTQSIAITHSTAHVKATVSKSVAVRKRPMKMDIRRTTLLVLLEMFVVFNETFEENPWMAMVWCSLGMLFGFLIMIIVLLLLRLPRKREDKRLFRLSQLESNEVDVASPTIQTNCQFPDSPPEKKERRYKIEEQSTKRSIPDTHQRGCNSLASTDSSLSITNANTLFTNPLWAESRVNKASTSGPLSNNNNPCKVELYGETTVTVNETTETFTKSLNESPDTSTNDQDQARKTCTRNEYPNNEINNQRMGRKIHSEADPPKIPVGIPSRRISVDSPSFHSCQASSVAVSNRPLETSEDKWLIMNSGSWHSLGKNLSNYTGKLLSRFGVRTDIHEAGYNTLPSTSSRASEPKLTFTLSDTALSAPCVHNKNFTTDTLQRPSLCNNRWKDTSDGTQARTANEQDNSDSRGNPDAVDRLENWTRSSRSQSVGSFTKDTYLKVENNEIGYHYQTPQVTINGETINSITRPSRLENISNEYSAYSTDSPHPDHLRENSLQIPFDNINNVLGNRENCLSTDVTNPQRPAVFSRCKSPRKSPPESRRSSGYYSNNPSPSAEHPFCSVNSRSSRENQKDVALRKREKERHMKDKQTRRNLLHPSVEEQTVNGGDDLPPLPPPPPPLPPPSPLPHLFALRLQSPKTKTHHDNHEQINVSKMSVKKVHFETTAP